MRSRLPACAALTTAFASPLAAFASLLAPFALPAPFALLAAFAPPALAFDANYRATIAGVAVGEGRLSGDVGGGSYSVQLVGSSGFAMWTSKFANRASGTLSGDRVTPARYVSQSEGRTSRTTTIAFSGGEARETISPTPEPSLMEGRVPLTEAHRRGVLDPLSGLVSQAIRSGAAADPCEGVVRAFSGWARFDVGLRPGERGEDGSITCRIAYRAIAGHRKPPPDAPRPVEGAPITVTFRGPAEGGLRLPQRIEVPLTVGSLVIRRVE